jgi:YbgC/YbaW family acyl-CoA thioester hydrolase
MNDLLESVIRKQPFTVRRTIRWADCDPAGVVYAGHYADYLIDAVTYFMRHIGFGLVAGKDRPVRVGLPCKHLELTFHTSLFPDDVIEIEIAVAQIREHTFDLAARACLTHGRLAFHGAFSPICIAPETRERVRIPSELRKALAQHHSGPDSPQ